MPATCVLVAQRYASVFEHGKPISISQLKQDKQILVSLTLHTQPRWKCTQGVGRRAGACFAHDGACILYEPSAVLQQVERPTVAGTQAPDT